MAASTAFHSVGLLNVLREYVCGGLRGTRLRVMRLVSTAISTPLVTIGGKKCRLDALRARSSLRAVVLSCYRARFARRKTFILSWNLFGIWNLEFGISDDRGQRLRGHLVSTFSLESLLNQFLIIAFGIIAEVSQTLFLGGALQKIGCSTGGTLDVDRLLP